MKSLSAVFLVAIIITGLLFVVTMNVGTAQGGATLYVISGFMFDTSGKVISGASTYLINSTGSGVSTKFYSDSSGFYYAVAPPGTYRLVSSGPAGSGLVYSEANIVLNSDITKNITLTTVSVSPTSATLDVGQSQSFTANASGGSGTYTLYEWYVNGTIKSAQNNSTFSFSPASAGLYSITAIVTDSSGATSSQSTVATVTVNSALVAPTISASKNTVDQGQTSNLTSTTVETGTSPYLYQWFAKAPNGNFLPISGATLPSYSFVTSGSTAIGVWSFVLKVTDSTSTQVTVTSAEFFVTVNAAPAVTVSPRTVALNAGQSQLFIATPNSGSGSYTGYQWYVNGAAQMGQTSSAFSFSPASAGSYSITARVTDNEGSTSAQSTAVTATASVIPTPTPTPSTSPVASPTSTPTSTPQTSPTGTPIQTPTSSPAPSPSPTIPEFPQLVIVAALMVVTMAGLIIYRKQRKKLTV